MGWSSGTGVISEVIESVQENVPDIEARGKIYYDLICIFEDHDWDNIDEIVGMDEVLDNIIRSLYPDLISDE